jgi:uncharacterized phage protein (TIGR02218 family)
MRTLSPELKAHLAQETTTLATLVRVERQDGQVFGFTDASDDITYAGVLFRSNVGHTPTNVKTTSALNVDNLEIETYLDQSAITEADAQAGLWDYAAVEIAQVNYNDLSMGHMTLRKGWMGQIRTGRNQIIAELRGMMQPLQQIIGRIYAPACDADLGDARCGIALASYTVTGTVTAVASQHQLTDSSRAETDAYFEGGKLTFTSGDNAGYSMEVKIFAAGVITLQQGMPNPIAEGDAYSLSAGCDKLLSTCRDKFSNVVNFRGFPHVPGTDRLISGT